MRGKAEKLAGEAAGSQCAERRKNLPEKRRLAVNARKGGKLPEERRLAVNARKGGKTAGENNGTDGAQAAGGKAGWKEEIRMPTIIFATGNKDKMKEIRMILDGMGVEILSMKEAGIALDVEENGTSFEENAMIKAKAVAERAKECFTDAVVLADDSGLEIDYLGGEPGIYSARYMGEDTSYKVKNQNLIDRLFGVPDEQRTARFVCAIAAVLPNGEYLLTRGVMEGRIGYAESGENGFGYDPIFVLPKYGCTTSDLPPEVKNEESHRGKALRAMREKLSSMRA